VTLEGSYEVLGFLRGLPLGVGKGEVDEGHFGLAVLGLGVVVHPKRPS